MWNSGVVEHIMGCLLKSVLEDMLCRIRIRNEKTNDNVQ